MFKPGSIRFFLATLVILYHITKFIPLGGFAVDCFFLMSGYWISVMYDHKYLKADNKFKVFYVSRAWRLLPLFYFFTICAVIINCIYHTRLWNNIHSLSSTDFAIFWLSDLTLLSYNISKFKLLATAWSLDVEMQFYILFPLLFYVYKNKKNNLILITAALLILSVILELYFSNDIIGKSVLVYLYLFLLGIIVYQFKLKFSARIEKICLTLFVILFISQTLIKPLRDIGLDTSSFAYIVLLNKIQLLLVFPTLTNSVYNKSDKTDRILGDLSYVIYVAHWAWIVPYNILINHSASKMARVPYALGFLIVTFGSSYIIYKLLDRPLENLRRKWVDSHIKGKKLVAEPSR